MEKNKIKPIYPSKVTADEKTAMSTIANKIIELIRLKHT
jgi:hypothetical protein